MTEPEPEPEPLLSSVLALASGQALVLVLAPMQAREMAPLPPTTSACLAHRAFRGRDALAAPGLLSGHLRRRPRRKMPIRMDPARGPAAQSDPSVQGSQNIEPRSPPYYYLISALASCRIPRRRRRLRRFRRRRFLVAF